MNAEPTNTPSPADRAPIEQDVFCPQCGYNLRGLTESRCPECGRQFDPKTPTVSQIPWVYRGRIGARRAYWRTVWLVTFHNRRFCEQVVHPVPYRSAQLFRWATILHIYLPVLIATTAVYPFVSSKPLGVELLDEALLLVWPVVTAHVALVLFLAAATGVPVCFFHSRAVTIEQEDRAIAMSHYTCAPLAWTPLALALVAAGVALSQILDGFTGVQFVLLLGLRFLAVLLVGIALIILLFVPALWLAFLVQLVGHTNSRWAGKPGLLMVALPVLWLGLAVLILGGLPLVVAYIGLVFVSLG